jgi:hypothetical protein
LVVSFGLVRDVVHSPLVLVCKLLNPATRLDGSSSFSTSVCPRHEFSPSPAATSSFLAQLQLQLLATSAFAHLARLASILDTALEQLLKLISCKLSFES